MRNLLLTATVVAATSVTFGELSAQLPDSVPPVRARDSVRVTGDSLMVADSFYVRPPIPEAVEQAFHDLMVTSSRAPGGVGVLQAGIAEAFVAAEYAWLAGRDSANVNAMRANMVHVLHAVDPAEASGGAGLGYGMRTAAQELLARVEVIESTDSVPDHVRFHVPYLRRAAEGALLRANQVVALARQVQRGSGAAQTLDRLEELRMAIRAMAYGIDEDGDNLIGNTADEVGLAQAWYHINLVYRTEEVVAPPLFPESLRSSLPDFDGIRRADAAAREAARNRRGRR